MPRTVAILGASRDRAKYGNKSVRAHVAAGYLVYPVNPNCAEVEGIPAYPDLKSIPVERLDRISVYVPPRIGRTLLPEIAARSASEVWFNPGSADSRLIAEAEALGIPVVQACSIIDAGHSPAEFGDA